MVRSMALCGLGKSAPLPVISTLKRFREEYEEHIINKKCRAKVCTALRQFHINPEFCKGCGKCAKNCPTGAITGARKHPYTMICVSSVATVRTTVRSTQSMWKRKKEGTEWEQ